MFEPFADVPAYPLVFPVFWGAVTELRIMESARVRPGPAAIPAALPAPDKALRLASASARPLIACPPVC